MALEVVPEAEPPGTEELPISTPSSHPAPKEEPSIGDQQESNETMLLSSVDDSFAQQGKPTSSTSTAAPTTPADDYAADVEEHPIAAVDLSALSARIDAFLEDGDAFLEDNPTTGPGVPDAMLHASRELSGKLRKSLVALDDVTRVFDEFSVCFNGGKEATVVLFLLAVARWRAGRAQKSISAVGGGANVAGAGAKHSGASENVGKNSRGDDALPSGAINGLYFVTKNDFPAAQSFSKSVEDKHDW